MSIPVFYDNASVFFVGGNDQHDAQNSGKVARLENQITEDKDTQAKKH